MVTLATGWGRTTTTGASIVRVDDAADVARLVGQAPPRGILARGLGRSYGDAALNSGGLLLDLSRLDSIDVDGDRVIAGAGVPLHRLIDDLLARGRFVPVTPGTAQVSIGGLIAADVHGKNHHRDGTFGAHVEEVTVVDGSGAIIRLRPDDASAPLFWATVGGMGLTGVIVAATLRVPRVETAWMRVDTEPFARLDDLMAAMVEADARAHYSVAWIDSAGRRRGRGILSLGEHALVVDLPPGRRQYPLARPRARQALRVPAAVPGGLLTPRSIAAFNQAWFAASGRPARARITALGSFFHPLDGVADWNRLYGPAGMVQFQCVVPDGHADAILAILDRLDRAGTASFLTVLKRFGPANPGPLSFPRPGWTLAVDLPAGTEGLAAALEDLDAMVVAAGGAGYLAKDARMSPETLRAGYPRLDEWTALRRQMDPAGVFTSDLDRRLLDACR